MVKWTQIQPKFLLEDKGLNNEMLTLTRAGTKDLYAHAKLAALLWPEHQFEEANRIICFAKRL